MRIQKKKRIRKRKCETLLIICVKIFFPLDSRGVFLWLYFALFSLLFVSFSSFFICLDSLHLFVIQSISAFSFYFLASIRLTVIVSFERKRTRIWSILLVPLLLFCWYSRVQQLFPIAVLKFSRVFNIWDSLFYTYTENVYCIQYSTVVIDEINLFPAKSGTFIFTKSIRINFNPYYIFGVFFISQYVHIKRAHYICTCWSTDKFEKGICVKKATDNVCEKVIRFFRWLSKSLKQSKTCYLT